MTEQLLSTFLAVVFSVGLCVLYFAGGSWLARRVCPAGGGKLRTRARAVLDPIVFLAPALILLGLYLVYPILRTTALTFFDEYGEGFVGWSNYVWAFNDPEVLQAAGNNMLWLLGVPAVCSVIGLGVAVLADRSPWGTVAKSLVFMPMAVSFVGASVIWKFVYEYRGPDAEQIGLFNAIVVFFGGEPRHWLTLPLWNNFFLMLVMVWLQTGFAMVVFSAALRGVPEDTLEAARIDGAGPVRIFISIILPQIRGTVVVVWTAITIIVLKVFDVVLAMTNGQWDTEVLANLMYDWMFRGGGDAGRGSVLALFVLVAVLPVMFFNIRRMRAQ